MDEAPESRATARERAQLRIPCDPAALPEIVTQLELLVATLNTYKRSRLKPQTLQMGMAAAVRACEEQMQRIARRAAPGPTGARTVPDR